MKRFFLLGCAILCLGACSTCEDDIGLLELPIIPEQPSPYNPPDKVAQQAVRDFLARTGAPAASNFEIARADLNGDGLEEALVLMTSPYGYWCDMHGCPVLVMKAEEDNFSLINAVQPVRAPLYVSDLETHGWKNLIVRVSGRWDEAKDVALQYDGKQYPDNPSNLPPYLRLAALHEMPAMFE